MKSVPFSRLFQHAIRQTEPFLADQSSALQRARLSGLFPLLELSRSFKTKKHEP